MSVRFFRTVIMTEGIPGSTGIVKNFMYQAFVNKGFQGSVNGYPVVLAINFRFYVTVAYGNILIQKNRNNITPALG